MNDPNEKKTKANPTSAGPAEGDSSSVPAKKDLTPEEQMALYEENLKETDWGHQPC